MKTIGLTLSGINSRNVEPCQPSKMELFARYGKVIKSAFWMSLSMFC